MAELAVWLATRQDEVHVLELFHRAMAEELAANADKGDRPGWLGATPPALLLDVHDHLAKLHLAAVEHGRRERGMIPRPLPWGDRDTASLVREFAADTANMAMMLADRLGVLDAPRERPAEYPPAMHDGRLSAMPPEGTH